MTPTVETAIVDPPSSPGGIEAGRGARQALAGCGSWPEVGTYAQYLAAVTRAGREASHAALIWDRFARRHGREDDPIEAWPTRLNVRFCVAHSVLQQRREVMKLLVDEPPAGRA